MFVVFYLLRTYILPDSFIFQITILNDIVYDVCCFSKEIIGGLAAMVIRLFLKGAIQDIFEALSESEIDIKGDEEIDMSRLEDPNYIYNYKGNGDSSNIDLNSGSGSASASGSAEASNSTEIKQKSGRVITYLDYQYDSDPSPQNVILFYQIIMTLTNLKLVDSLILPIFVMILKI